MSDVQWERLACMLWDGKLHGICVVRIEEMIRPMIGVILREEHGYKN